MALTSNESRLLAQTAQQVTNLAANVQAVLDVVNSITGDTGVTALATHISAAETHANAVNLQHVYNSGRSVYMGLGTDFNNPYFGSISARCYPVTVVDEADPVNSASVRGHESIFSEVLSSNTSNAGQVTFNTAICSGALSTLASSANLSSSSSYQIGRIAAYMYDAEYYASPSAGVWSAGIFCRYGDAFDTSNFAHTTVTIMGGATRGVLAMMLQFSPTGVIASNNASTLGIASKRFNTAYLVDAPNVSSDARKKDGVETVSAETAEAFIKALRPVSFILKEASQTVEEWDEDGRPVSVTPVHGTRRHFGLIAQEVRQAMDAAGIPDSGLWCLDNKDDPESMQSLRYEEFIAPLLAVVKAQQERIEALERKVA